MDANLPAIILTLLPDLPAHVRTCSIGLISDKVSVPSSDVLSFLSSFCRSTSLRFSKPISYATSITLPNTVMLRYMVRSIALL